jgi:phosphonate transport system ATP-binding protein
MKKAILQVKNVTKIYNDNSVKAVNDVSLDISEGEIVAIIGPSGSGKSTLLRCINRLVETTEGSIIFDDIEVVKADAKTLKNIRQHIGMIFQHYNLVYRLNVLENVLHGKLSNYSFFQSLLGLFKKEDVDKAIEIINILGLEDKIYEKTAKLSGGQKQRVGIARALLQDPKLILCDEPIASLDPQSSKVIMDYLLKIAKEFKIPVLVSLHQVDVAIKYADRIIGMSLGEVVFNGKPDDLKRSDIEKIYSASKESLLDINIED